MRYFCRSNAILLAVVLSVATSAVWFGAGLTRHVSAAPSAGAALPFVGVQAEDAATNGALIGPDRHYPGLATEAVGRRAVTLTGQGQYVEFTVPQAANSIVLRYSIPDSAAGTGLNATLSLSINGVTQPALALTSKHSWTYGTYPFNNNPGDVRPHHFYDEVHRLVGQMPAGTKVRVFVGAGDSAPSYTIDLMDFEQVAPALSQPAGSLSLTADFGADPSGNADATAATQNAVNTAAGQGKVLWVPPGTYKINAQIHINNVTIKGAGMWHSTFHFINPNGSNAGFYGNYAPTPSTNVHLSDFAIFGQVVDRVTADQKNGIGGSFNNSTIDRLWIEHTKCGLWLDGPFDNLAISQMRIRNQQADGVNFHKGVTNSSFTQSHFRNTGDDAMAMWSDSNGTSIANRNNSFAFNTIEVPVLANGIALYGGTDNSVTDNYVADQQAEGGGIHVGNRFSPVTPVAGTTTIARNVIVRTGSMDYYNGWNFGTGAIWFWALDAELNGTINVDDNQIIDSNFEAIHFIGDRRITNVSFNRNQIIGAGTYAIEVRAPGAVTFSNTTASGLGHGGVMSCRTDFAITNGGGNGSWLSSGNLCPPSYPSPIYGPVATPTPAPTNTPVTGQTPYPGGAHAIPGTIQAENFDNGGEGVAFHDIDAANNGGQYRTTAVDIEATTDSGGGYNVGWFDAGEWLEYTVNVPTAGTYALVARVATNTSGAAFRVEANGVDTTGTVAVNSTGGWQTWANVTRNISLSAGTQVLRVFAVGAGVNFNALSFSAVSTPTTTPQPTATSQPTATNTPGQTPYPGGAHAIPGTIQAENFDNGGEGVAFHDTDTVNTGTQYRTTGVDIEAATDAGGGYNVGWMDTGEWLEYTVNVPTAGTYTLIARVASNAAGGSFRVEFNGADKTGAVGVNVTGGWQTWADVTRSVSLSAGTQVLRFYVINAGFNLNALSFSAVSTPTNTPQPTATSQPTATNTPGQSPYPGGAHAIPGTIQAENFDNGGEGVAFHDTDTINTGMQYRTTGVDIEGTSDAGGGYNVGWMDTGEWLEYTVNVPTAGTYTLIARVASNAAGGSFRVDVNGADKTGAVGVNVTGGWQTWVDVTRSVSLSAGTQVLRFYVINAGFNLNALSFSAVGTTPTPTCNYPNWVAGQQYVTGNIVRYNGGYYIAEHDNPGYDPIVSTWYWEPYTCGSNPTPTPPPGTGFSSIVTKAQFEQMFPNRNQFYTYEGLVEAAAFYPAFAGTGTTETRKREAAAALANFAHETGNFIYINEINQGEYCSPSAQWPCAPGKRYFGRGPIQLSWNFNYGVAGQALNLNLLNDPDMVSREPAVAWKTALWFWMTSTGAGSMTSHNAIVNGNGFGETIRTINGSLECNGGNSGAVQSRVNSYQSISAILGVSPGNNLYC